MNIPTVPEFQGIEHMPQLSGVNNLNGCTNPDGPSSFAPFVGPMPAGPEQTTQNTNLIPSQPSYTPAFDTNDCRINISVELRKPRPTKDAVILLRIENLVCLDIDLPLQSWDTIKVPSTKSVKRIDSPSEGDKPLTLEIHARGATTGQKYDGLCNQCQRREGKRNGPPRLIDFHGPSNIIRPKNRTIQVNFTIRCYSRHHREEDEQYVYVTVAR